MSDHRWAVLVGVDEYPNLRADQQLRGCVHDAELMSEMLQGPFGFRSDGVTLLRNAEASREAILGALDELIEKAQPDDVVVVHYSGHGSQMTDREGDESDKYDETIVPADSGRGSAPNRDITDDELYDVVRRLTAKTQLVTLVFDCCHSGSVTRDLSAVRVRRIERDERPASELPPSPIQVARGTRGLGPSGWLPPGRRYTLLAGCRDEELSHEFDPPDGPTHGALTWFLAGALTAARPGASYRDVFEVAAAGVRAQYPSQHPQIEGAVDREVFGVSDFTPTPFLSVLNREGDAVTLGGGAAQGVVVDSRWAVYPAGARTAAEEERLGSLRVTAARATTAAAAIEDEVSAGAVAPQTRVVREGRDPAPLLLRVAVPDDQPELVQLVDDSWLLERVSPNATADARVVRLSPRDSAAADDPVPQLKALSEASIAVLGADGRLLVPTRLAAAEGTPTRVRDDLETVAKYRRTLALENRGSRLAGAVELTLLRRAADGAWVVAEPEMAGGEVVYEEHEEIGLRLASRHDAPLYPAVLDLGLTYAVSLVHPYAGHEELAPGSTVEIGTRPGEEIPLQIPEAFPFGGDADDADSGVETVKLFVTTQPANYEVLLQEGVVRDMAARDFGRPVTEDWAAVSRSFRLRRATPSATLEPDGAVVEAGGVQFSTPGVQGYAAPLDAGGGGRTRSRELSTDALEGVLRSESLDVQAAVELTDVAAAADTRAVAEPVLEIRAPAPAAGEGQMVLLKDEAGVLTWHFALPSRDVGDERRTYRIDRRVVVTQEGHSGTRGLVGAVGTKLLKVLVFPLVEPVIGEVADYFAGRWEAKRRPYRLRRPTPDDFATPGGADLHPPDWEQLSGKRALLLIHGTFSRSHSGFGRLPRETFEALYKRYEGRVLGLDHFTLSHTPQQNAEWLFEQIPDGRELDVDIVCHSRGGLVARTVAERQSELSLGSKRVRVNRVIFVATPNAGTVLADGDHLGDLLDVFTNILNFVPDNGVTDILEGVVTVTKMLAVGALKGLDGLTAMVPAGEFQQWLNTGPAPAGTSYRALASNYEPTIAGFADFASDLIMDAVFAKRGNDLVVPTDGVYSGNGAALFPIEERHVFATSDGVGHTTFFSHSATHDKLLAWLSGG